MRAIAIGKAALEQAIAIGRAALEQINIIEAKRLWIDIAIGRAALELIKHTM